MMSGEPIVLKSRLLEVRVARPDPSMGSRFDRTGWVRSVRFGGVEFCSRFRDADASGVGLCNEFGLGAALGFDPAAKGKRFPKIGVGLLDQPDRRPYRFYRAYAVDPFETRVRVGRGRAEFVQVAAPCGPIAFELRKEVAVDGPLLRVSYALHNSGRETLVTDEYNHNFLAIGGAPVGPDYALRFSFGPAVVWRTRYGTVRGRDMAFERPVRGTIYWGGPGPRGGGPHAWTLVHRPSGLRISEMVWGRVSRVAVWAMAHVISPELFVPLRIPPGATAGWDRVWAFSR